MGEIRKAFRQMRIERLEHKISMLEKKRKKEKRKAFWFFLMSLAVAAPLFVFGPMYLVILLFLAPMMLFVIFVGCPGMLTIWLTSDKPSAREKELREKLTKLRSP